MPGHRHTRPGPGESRAFHFVTTWVVEASVEAAWEVLADVGLWPGWWPGIESAGEAGPAGGSAGRAARVVVRSPLGYRLRLTLVLTGSDPPYRSAFGVDGDLRGRGFWAAEEQGSEPEVTRMRIGWCVVSDRRLVRRLAWLARWAHGQIMAAGEAGLARRLGQGPPGECPGR